MRKRFKFRAFALIAAFLIFLCGAASAVSADEEEEQEERHGGAGGTGYAPYKYIEVLNGDSSDYSYGNLVSDIYKVMKNHDLSYSEALTPAIVSFV